MTQRLERTERKTLRRLCSVTITSKKSTEELRNCLGIDSMSDVIRSGRLKRFGYVKCKEESDYVNACRD